MMNTNKLTRTAMLSALAIICGYIESLLPSFTVIPGVKPGISNIIILFALCRFGKADAFFVMLIKVGVSSMLFGNPSVFFYSLGGGILSFAAMSLLRKLDFSVIAVSIIGGIFHNIGQLSIAAAVLKSAAVFYYLPVLLISGAACGAVTGYICSLLLARLKPDERS